MASAANLMGLVSQLQNMEQSLSNILVEHCLKLASLTDANVFLLIETTEGRRYAGKRHLCESYSNGSLAPIGTDIELGLESNEPRLVEKNNFSWQQNASWQHSSMGDASFSSMNSPHHSTPPSRKRQSQQQQQQPSRSANTLTTATKKARLATALADGAATLVDAPSSSSSSLPTSGPENTADLHMVVDVKSEQPAFDDDEAQRHQEYHHAGDVDEDDDDDIQEIPVEGDDAHSRSHVSAGDGFNNPDQQQLQPYNAGFGSGQMLPDGTDMINGMVNEHLCTYLRGSSKARMFKTLQDPSFIENTSPTFKILNSLCYDVSKYTASVFPCHPYCGDPFKLLFFHMFESFWAFFKEPFHQFEALDMFDGSRRTKFKSYVKSVLQRRLRENLKKQSFHKQSTVTRPLRAIDT